MGLTVTPKLIWTRAKETLATQARKSITTLYKLQHNIGYFDYLDLFKLFDTMVKPVLLYGAEIWGCELSNVIENVQNQFFKSFFKVTCKYISCSCQGECGRNQLFIDYYCKCIKYWIRLIRMNNSRYSYHCYKMLRNLDNSGRITWATKVKNILFKYGFGYACVNENVGDENLFLKNF